MKYQRFIYSFLPAALFILVFCAPGFAQTDQKTKDAQKPVQTTQKKNLSVARMWHGRTTDAKADEYYEYLMEAGIKKFETIPGNLGVQVFRASKDGITEFTVISYWKSFDVIRNYAGEDISKTRHLPRDKEFLLELEPTVRHFEVVFEKR